MEYYSARGLPLCFHPKREDGKCHPLLEQQEKAWSVCDLKQVCVLHLLVLSLPGKHK